VTRRKQEQTFRDREGEASAESRFLCGRQARASLRSLATKKRLKVRMARP